VGITPSKNEQECSGVLESMKFNLVVVILCHFFFYTLINWFFSSYDLQKVNRIIQAHKMNKLVNQIKIN
jgi:hypothetical protein